MRAALANRYATRDPAVVGPGDEAGGVRYGEPDEADGPGDDGGPAAEDHHGQGGDHADGPDALAEAAGEVVAEGEGVELRSESQGENGADEDERRDLPQHLGAAGGQRTELPEPELVVAAPVLEQDRAGDRGEDGGGRGPRQRQLHRCRTFPPERADPVHEEGGEQRAEEAEPDELGGDREPEQGDRADDGHGRAGVDAEELGVGEGITGDALHHRAREAERRAGQQPGDGARDADLQNDELALDGRVRVEHPVHDVTEGHVARADGEAGDGGEEQDGEGGKQPEGEHGAAALAPRFLAAAGRFLLLQEGRAAHDPAAGAAGMRWCTALRSSRWFVGAGAPWTRETPSSPVRPDREQGRSTPGGEHKGAQSKVTLTAPVTWRAAAPTNSGAPPCRTPPIPPRPPPIRWPGPCLCARRTNCASFWALRTRSSSTRSTTGSPTTTWTCWPAHRSAPWPRPTRTATATRPRAATPPASPMSWTGARSPSPTVRATAARTASTTSWRIRGWACST
ncbi:hypothetical protein SBADM41S_03341 [Streptomyces badius]